MEIIQRGAEAVLYILERDGEKVLVKERIKKGYRIPQLDRKIRSQRTKGEANLISKARRYGVNTPIIFDTQKFNIFMEFIDGKRLKDILNNLPKKEKLKIYSLIGEAVAKLHEADIMHGDLTTSNMLLLKNKLYVIDFGLGKTSKRIEDKAVDLYLLYEALKATHFKVLEEAWKSILNTYKQKYSKSKLVINQLNKIEKRRRYK